MESQLIQLSILIPLVIGFTCLFLSSRIPEEWAKPLALVGFAFPAVVSIGLFYQYTTAAKISNAYAFYSDLDTGLGGLGISLKLGLNGISAPMFLLAGIVGLAAGIYAIFAATERLTLYLSLLLIMQAGLMGTFASIDIFFFYFFHELALIPTFIMIGIWGGRGRRSIAMELTIYLTLGALLSLTGLIALYVNSGINSFDLITLREYLSNVELASSSQKMIAGLLIYGFGILVSLFPFHSWAPRGYGAAPTSAAMLHAGVLKKFGLYGLIQIALPLIADGIGQWTTMIAGLAICNIIVLGLVTIAKRNLKQMIGYSSVMHMGYCFLGIACLSTLGAGGAVILMFAHGLSVALLFLLSTMIHQRTNTLRFVEMGGLSQQAPILCGFFLAATLANIGLPGFANFWGELIIFISLWQFSPALVFLAVAGVVISAIYGLRSVASIFFGPHSEFMQDRLKESPIADMTLRERIPALILLITLLIAGFWPAMLTKPLNFNLKTEQTSFLVAKNLEK